MSHDTEAAHNLMEVEQGMYVDVNFAYAHLPEERQEISREFHDFVWRMMDRLPPNHMRQTFLDYMLLAKDAGVRTSLPGQR